MGRGLAFVVVLVACGVEAARADEPPPPVDSPIATPPPPSSTTPAPTTPYAPPPTAVVHSVGADGFTVDRHGLMLLGGFAFVDGDRTQEAVLYIPLPIAPAPRLKLGVTGSVQYHRDFVPDGDDFVAWAYFVQVMPQYDWRLPIASRKGDFALAAEVGVGYGQLWARFPEAPYMPPGWQHISGATVNAAGQFQFHAHNGFVVSVQPLGLRKPVYHSALPGPFWSYSDEIIVELSLMAGYRWR